MAFTTGTILSHYEITSQIGKGGMGEVYQAKDTKLGRSVAIKVLPEEFAKDADRVARFQREAKLLASLNHPNIAAIYGLEESDDTHFLVMELVEGQTLDERIKSGPIPVEEALKLALQIAEALEAAHEKGVIHRDLKPANIKVTPDGKVKVLDFGLAKAFAGEQADLNLSNSPTLSVAATQQGVILGTAAYMSPEQARGKEVDKRTDIWAFGGVLFEMLTRKQVFTGDTVSDTLASVLAREPEWENLPQNLHPRIWLLLERCLEKDPKNRYHDIADARVDIQKALSDPGGAVVQPTPPEKPRKKLQSLPWIVSAILLAFIILGAVVWIRNAPETQQTIQFDYDLPEGQAFTGTGNNLIAVSPDGTKIVYVADKQLYLKYLDQLAASPIDGTNDDPANPFFSPDGNWVGYFAQGQLKKIEIGSGVPVKICDVTQLMYGATWNTNGTILFGQPDCIMSVSEDPGSIAEILIPGEEGEAMHGPSLLPGGEWVLFTSTKAPGINRWDMAEIIAVSLKTKDRNILKSGGSDARYVPSGHLVYAKENVLYAEAFDIDRMKLTGNARPVIQGIPRAYVPVAQSGTANYCFSDKGTLVYVVNTSGREELVWLYRDGKEEKTEAPIDNYNNPRISEDGSRVALDINVDENIDVYVWDFNSKTRPRITHHETIDGAPVWGPDRDKITFASDRNGNGIYKKSSNGTGEAELVCKMDNSQFPSSWSPDGKYLVLTINNDTSWSDLGISMLSMGADPEIEALIDKEYSEKQPQISPDGKWIAYASDETGRFEIYVVPFPDVEKDKKTVSLGGGSEPRWSRDMDTIYYRNGRSIMAAPVIKEPALSFGTPEPVFRGVGENLGQTLFAEWDVSPDGTKVLMIKPVAAAEGAPNQEIVFVTSWFEELKERVPVE